MAMKSLDSPPHHLPTTQYENRNYGRPASRVVSIKRGILVILALALEMRSSAPRYYIVVLDVHVRL